MPAFRLGHNKSRADEEHAVLGAQLVGSLGIEGLPSWVRAHHERWDGSGFPDGLVGEQIPLEARIIALADAYDGMTAGRRGGSSSMSKSAALQEIDHGIGNRFDPDLAERFIEVVGRTASFGWSDEWPAA
jgi:HD-GYP domain-containing protein (c-di-GMP phosphodiesterase class II)